MESLDRCTGSRGSRALDVRARRSRDLAPSAACRRCATQHGSTSSGAQLADFGGLEGTKRAAHAAGHRDAGRGPRRAAVAARARGCCRSTARRCRDLSPLAGSTGCGAVADGLGGGRTWTPSAELARAHRAQPGADGRERRSRTAARASPSSRSSCWPRRRSPTSGPLEGAGPACSSCSSRGAGSRGRDRGWTWPRGSSRASTSRARQVRDVARAGGTRQPAVDRPFGDRRELRVVHGAAAEAAGPAGALAALDRHAPGLLGAAARRERDRQPQPGGGLALELQLFSVRRPRRGSRLAQRAEHARCGCRSSQSP